MKPGPRRRSSNPQYKLAARAVRTLPRGLTLSAGSTKSNNLPAASQLYSELILRTRAHAGRRDGALPAPAPIVRRSIVEKRIDGMVLTVPSWFAPAQLDVLQDAAGAATFWSRSSTAMYAVESSKDGLVTWRVSIG
jgi:hypothetical protein